MPSLKERYLEILMLLYFLDMCQKEGDLDYKCVRNKVPDQRHGGQGHLDVMGDFFILRKIP